MVSSSIALGAPWGMTGSTPLPVNLPQLEGLDLKARYHSDRCNGDFFDGVAIGSRVVFLLMDIAGRRAEAHPIAAEVQNVFRTRAQDLFESPDANESEAIALLVHDVNRSLMEAAHGVRFAPAIHWHPSCQISGPAPIRTLPNEENSNDLLTVGV